MALAPAVIKILQIYLKVSKWIIAAPINAVFH